MADVNHDLFVKVLAQIEREPERWFQKDYSNDCGTAYCLAGWACLFATDLQVDKDGDWNGPDGRMVDVHREAIRVLGLPRLDGYDRYDRPGLLFGPDNTLDDLYRISADLMGIDAQVLRDKVAAEVHS